TGANVWHALDAWPPAEATSATWTLGANHTLRLDATAGEAVVAAAHTAEASAAAATDDERASGYDEYVSDPARPVPYINYAQTTMARDYMVDDQRFAAKRADVLVYQSEPLSADLTIAGPITPSLVVSTSGTDSDWIVKVIDVYPSAPTTISPRM